MRWVLAVAVGLSLSPMAAHAQLPTGIRSLVLTNDLNSDGAVTKAEARASRERLFGLADGDRDGALSADERARAGQMSQIIAMADTNNDGNVSQAEFMAAPYRAFETFDANRNDTLEAGEISRMP